MDRPPRPLGGFRGPTATGSSRGRIQTAVISCVGAMLVLTACTDPDPTTVTVPGTNEQGTAAVVGSVVDGDTIEVTFGGGPDERLRLLGIDTPETVKPNAPVDCFGPEASAATKHLLVPGTTVIVQRDTEARDRYGRLLGYVWRTDGTFVNRVLVVDGFARTLSIAPNTAHRADLAAAAAEARAAGRGLWSSCPPES